MLSPFWLPRKLMILKPWANRCNFVGQQHPILCVRLHTVVSFCCWMLLHKVWKPHHTVMEMIAMLVAQLAVLAASLWNLFVTYNRGGMMSIWNNRKERKKEWMNILLLIASSFSLSHHHLGNRYCRPWCLVHLICFECHSNLFFAFSNR